MSRDSAAPRLTARAFTNDDIREVAATQGVCVRPVLRKVTDQQTGEVHKLVIPCGSTREYRCPPCAKKAQRLRMQQCAEGWHLDDDPLPPEPDPADREEPEPDEDGNGDGEGEEPGRTVRSTRRRSEVPDLPRAPAEHRSVGRRFTAPDGTTYRPSMFVTVTLPSYGKVTPFR